jgi:hypothetical protein
VGVVVAVDPELGQVQIAPAANVRFKDLVLWFDPATGHFEGTTVDHQIVPVPGELPPLRSALDVLTEEVLNLATSSP